MSNVAWRPTPLRRAAVVGQAVGAGLLILAGVLPWVRYHQLGTTSMHTVHAGTFTPELVAIGVAAVVMAALQLARPSLAVSVAVAVAGIGGFALTVLAAAGRMASQLADAPLGRLHDLGCGSGPGADFGSGRDPRGRCRAGRTVAIAIAGASPDNGL
jgi:hypothetical protein